MVGVANAAVARTARGVLTTAAAVGDGVGLGPGGGAQHAAINATTASRGNPRQHAAARCRYRAWRTHPSRENTWASMMGGPDR